ncbi:MAG: hypothetical protein NT029_16135 [Armatimonadetes bacterium]|nr:hypothetical protein [Armatimonadota bacterium]
MSARHIARLGLFGALWGIVEMSLGTALQAAHVPMRGTLLAAIGITVALVGAAFVPRRGALLTIGLVAAALRLFGLSGPAISSVAAIAMEALLAEACLAAFGYRRSRASYVAAGATAVLWDLFHPGLGALIIGGPGVAVSFWRAAHKAAQALHLPGTAPAALLVTLGLLRLAVGSAAGWTAYTLIEQVRCRFVLDDA